MISEKDKQVILNGSFGISRDGWKCKLVGITTSLSFKYFFIYFNEEGLVISHNYLNENFHEYKDTSSKYDVIGVWKDEPEPFNLEKALAGEPVMLRNGSKAYVKFVMPSEYKGAYPLNGYITNPYSSDVLDPEQWTIEGREYNDDDPYDYDIISMWKDPEPKTLTLTLPCPLKEPKDAMWFIDGTKIRKSDYTASSITAKAFEQVTYFGSKEDAQAWCDAMLNSRNM